MGVVVGVGSDRILWFWGDLGSKRQAFTCRYLTMAEAALSAPFFGRRKIWGGGGDYEIITNI